MRLSKEELVAIKGLRVVDKLSIEKIARRRGLPWRAVQAACNEHGWTARIARATPWSERDIETLRTMYPGGAPATEIAAALERETGPRAVYEMAAKLKIRRPVPLGQKRRGVKPQDGDEGPVFTFTDEDQPAEETKARPARAFSEIEKRRVIQFLARGDTLADIARQMRCDVDDIRAIPGIASELPQGRDCGGAGARRQPKTTTTEPAPRHDLPPPG